jgi:MFS transporter, FHS family, L-fucose permease
MAAISASTGVPTNAADGNSYRGPFAMMTVLFFMWGFMTVFNDILIPRFKEAFQLSYYQAMLVQFAFFGAYFSGSVIYFVTSVVSGDPLARMGYKNGVVLGLLISAAGSAIFWPAAAIHSYPLFLAALFVVGLGFAMLQIAANPYVTILGPERTASSRLNLAQGFNSLGTFIGPLIGGYLIFQYFAKTGAHGAESVKIPYLAFCVVFVMLAGVFSCIHLPHIGEGKIEGSAGALKYPHVVLGILCIFMYVGGEVSVGSTIISFLGQPSVAGMKEVEAKNYVSLFWGGMMIGRFMGSVEMSELKTQAKQLLLGAIPIAGFLLYWAILGGAVVRLYPIFLLLCWGLFQISKGLPGRTLLIFSSTVVVLLATAVLAGGEVAMWCVVGVGLFSSIGWSNTFSLAIEGVGIYKSQASSLLVMAILGGALLPPLQGKIADVTKNLQISFVVPMIAYAYVAFYGAIGHRIGRAATPI